MKPKKQKYDAIVIGVGPAGSHFAKKCAEAGMSVICFDKRKEIGAPVRCAEGLGDQISEYIDFEIPKKARTSDITGLKIYAPNENSFTFKKETTTGAVLDRKIFDKMLAEQATQAGAEIYTYSIVEDIIYNENKKIIGVKVDHLGEKYSVYADLIVSAEGMEARIARKVGLVGPANLKGVDTCFQYEIGPIEHENMIEVYYGNEIAPRGYIWIFPKEKGFANVGIGIAGNYNIEKEMGANPKELLDKWIEKHKQRFKNASYVAVEGGVICVDNTEKNLSMDNFIVIGTAARQVDPLHGGGIGNALIAADIASKVVIDIYKNGKEFDKKNLKKYDENWYKSKIQKEMDFNLKVRKFLEKLSDEDMNKITEIIDNKDIDSLLEDKNLGVISKIAIKYPKIFLKIKDLI